jgi:hypothetical protein
LRLNPSGIHRLSGSSQVGKVLAYKSGVKVATRQPRKTLDYFTYTIVPHQTLQAVAVFTIKHGVLIFGITAGAVAVMRQLLAD